MDAGLVGTENNAEESLIPLADPERCYELVATVRHDTPERWKPT